MTIGLIVGNRGFFPDHLAKSGREEMIAVLKKAGVEVVVLGPDDSKYGAVETRAEARTCADLFRPHRDAIDGVIVTLPNFGDERGDRGHAPHGRPRRAGAGPGHARHAVADDDPGPARQLLREDVGLQQPEAVRHPVLAHHAAHRGADLARVRARSRLVPRRVPRREGAPRACASARSARGRPRSTPSASARSCSRRPASRSSRSTCRRSSAASTG